MNEMKNEKKNKKINLVQKKAGSRYSHCIVTLGLVWLEEWLKLYYER